MKVLVIDTETTGLRTSDRIVSLAFVLVEDGQVKGTDYWLVNPLKTIPAETTAIHGLCNEDVKDAPSYEQLRPVLQGIIKRCGVTHMVAHNSAFDYRMAVDLTTLPWLDTLMLARELCPNLDSYKNMAVAEHLKVQLPVGTAHNALYDAQVTAGVFIELAKLAHLQGVDKLELLGTYHPPLLKSPRCPFGKHKGSKWDSLPNSYLKWVLKELDQDRDVWWLARAELMRRGELVVPQWTSQVINDRITASSIFSSS